tara:strand:+ start:861 stop:1514 length:654 start_codon:yes stop_codon:yes gene_type:complete
MKKLIKGSFAVVLCLLFFACSEEDNLSNEPTKTIASFKGKSYFQTEINKEREKVKKQEINSLFKSHFGINNIKLLKPDSKLAFNLNLKKEAKITEYSFEDSSSKFYITKDSGLNNTYHFFKVNTIGQGNTHRLEVANSLTLELENDKIVLIKEFKNKNSITPVRDEFRWCQQEPQDNGSASACNDREYDEFTEDWVGFIAYWSNPQIAILIALMCRC